MPLAACLLSWMVLQWAACLPRSTSSWWVCSTCQACGCCGEWAAYVTALKTEALEVARCGGLKQALQDAQQLAVGSAAGDFAVVKRRRKGSTEALVVEWAREMERELASSGWLWEAKSDGTVGLGLPQNQFVSGGVFATVLPDAAQDRLEDVRRELGGAGNGPIRLATAHRGVPISTRPPVGVPEAVMLSGGGGPGVSPAAVGPTMEATDLSLYPPLELDPSRCPLGGSEQPSVVLLSDLPAEVQLQQAATQHLMGQTSGAGLAEVARLVEERRMGMARIGVPPPFVTLLARAGRGCLRREPGGPVMARACRYGGLV